MIDATIKALLSGTRPLYEWTGLEQVPAMIDGGGADTGGPNALPHGKAIWKPGTATTSALLVFNPAKRLPGQFWDNCYEYNTITRTPPKLVYASWEIEFAILQSDLGGNAREFEIELCESGQTYNMAWQYKWSKVDGPPAWRIFNQIKGGWEVVMNTPIPVPKAGVPIHAQAFFSIDRSAGTTTHESIIIDGTEYPVNATHAKKQKWSPTANYLHNAVQIDSMGDGKPCAIQINKWNVRGL